MKTKKGYFTTDVDRFLYLLEQNKTISIKKLSSELNLPEDILEKWAEVFELKGIVSIKYPLFRSLILKYNPDNKNKYDLDSNLETSTSNDLEKLKKQTKETESTDSKDSKDSKKSKQVSKKSHSSESKKPKKPNLKDNSLKLHEHLNSESSETIETFETTNPNQIEDIEIAKEKVSKPHKSQKPHKSNNSSKVSHKISQDLDSQDTKPIKENSKPIKPERQNKTNSYKSNRPKLTKSKTPKDDLGFQIYDPDEDLKEDTQDPRPHKKLTKEKRERLKSQKIKALDHQVKKLHRLKNARRE